MVLLSHPTGNAFVREAASALHEARLLEEFHTCIAACGGNLLAKIAALPGCGEIRRREIPAELKNNLRLHPFREIGRLVASRAGFNFTIKHEEGFLSIDAVYRAFDKSVSNCIQNGNFKSVYSYEDGAFETFRAAKSKRLTCIYDLPIAHWKTVQQLMEEEANRLPNWACTMEGLRDSDQKLRRKDAELELADVVICPSFFVRNSLPLEILQKKRVEVVPFGSPVISESVQESYKAGPLRVLFVGSMTQRKGLADLFSAIKMLDSNYFELHVLGTPITTMSFYKSQLPNFIHHNPRANAEVLNLMRSCDVFVLPSLVEGRALVQQEAMSCGLPIIVTRNAGGEDLVEDGKAGYLVPIRDPSAIANKLELLFKNKDLLIEMGKAAKSKAQSLTWADYRMRIVEIAKSVANG
jgi:glycosyltransferase involved in cell wall biosynthesis